MALSTHGDESGPGRATLMRRDSSATAAGRGGTVIYLADKAVRRDPAIATRCRADRSATDPKGFLPWVLARLKADPKGHAVALLGWLVIFGWAYLALRLIGA